jgi:tetratricopeptide (TPR) repeat protein
MKNLLRIFSFAVIALFFMTLSACNSPERSENGVVSTGAKIGSGAAEASLAEFSKAIQLDSTSAKAYAGRGAIKYATGDKKGALADLTKAIELDPQSATAYSGRATAKYAEGDISGAIADVISAAKVVVFSSFNQKSGN